VLIRWQRPGHGMVSPALFILAGRDGLIVRVGTWVLHEACRKIADWGKPMGAVHLSVNRASSFSSADWRRKC
jgi:EAL domain-containing protein (putative c-di-GMP-specific phosphodiesterase class I)